MSTQTPPPYFPQNPLSPGDEKTRRRLKLILGGCLVLLLLACGGILAGIVYLLRS